MHGDGLQLFISLDTRYPKRASRENGMAGFTGWCLGVVAGPKEISFRRVTEADAFGVDEALEAAHSCFAHKLPFVFSVNASA